MLGQITAVKEKGFKPILYVDDFLARNEEMLIIIRQARKLNVDICFENNSESLHRVHKAHVFRYGTIPNYLEAMIKRKGGVIVSGNLVVS